MLTPLASPQKISPFFSFLPLFDVKSVFLSSFLWPWWWSSSTFTWWSRPWSKFFLISFFVCFVYWSNRSILDCKLNLNKWKICYSFVFNGKNPPKMTILWISFKEKLQKSSSSSSEPGFHQVDQINRSMIHPHSQRQRSRNTWWKFNTSYSPDVVFFM